MATNCQVMLRSTLFVKQNKRINLKKKEDYVKREDQTCIRNRKKKQQRLDYMNNDHNHQIDKDKALSRQKKCSFIFKIVT